jgi:hypothetical protein
MSVMVEQILDEGHAKRNVAAAFRLPRHNGTCRCAKVMKTQDEGLYGFI